MAEVLHAEIRAEATGGETLEHVRGEVRGLRQEIAKLHQEERHAVGFGSRLAETMALVSERTEGMREHLFEMRDAFGETRNMGGELLPALGALGAAMSVTGLVEMTREAAEARTQLNAMAETLGITTSQLQAYRLVAQEADVPIEDMQGSILKLDKAMEAAASGKNKDVAAIFGHMGINIRDANGHLKSVTEVLPLVARSLSRTHDETLRNAVAMQLFGRSGAYLIPFLKEAASKMGEMQKRSDQLNASLSEEDTKKIEAFKNSWVELDTAVGGLKDTITSDLAPVLTPMLNELSDYISVHKKGIGSTIRDDFIALKNAVGQVDWKTLKTDTAAVEHVLNEGARHVGGWTRIAEALAVIAGLKFAISAAKPIIEMGKISYEAFKLAGTLTNGLAKAWDRVGERAAAAGEKEEIAATVGAGAGGGAVAKGTTAAAGREAAVVVEDATKETRVAAERAGRMAVKTLFKHSIEAIPVLGAAMMATDIAVNDLPPVVHYLDRANRHRAAVDDDRKSARDIRSALDTQDEELFYMTGIRTLPGFTAPAGAVAPTAADSGVTVHLKIDLSNPTQTAATVQGTLGNVRLGNVDVGQSYPMGYR